MLPIEAFLEERYPAFVSRHRLAARSLARFLGFLFCERRFAQFERDYPHLRGFDFVEQLLRYFDFSLRLSDRERERIPASGRVVIVANHPLGTLDGLALLRLVQQVRPDVKVVANELLSAVEPLHPVLLPVNNMGGNTGRANLRNIQRHLEEDGALIIFPAGEVSRFGPKGVKDGVWLSGFVRIARRARAPIQPVFVAGRNSVLFYSLSFLARPISTLWLVREMFRQSHNTVDARVGNPVTFEQYTALQVSADKLAALFRKHVYRLARDGRPVFDSVENVAHPENRLLLKRELQNSERLGESPDGMQIHVCRMAEAPCVMREIGRLRELTFRTVGEGTGLPRDIDCFDRDYLQLVLWDPQELEIAGAYRLGEANRLLLEKGWGGLYTATLFNFDDSALPYLQQGLELGRSFVQPRYQSRNSLDYLWCGIGAFLRKYPGYRYLFGAASISPHYGHETTSLLAWFYARHYRWPGLNVRGRNPPNPTAGEAAAFAQALDSSDPEQDLKSLRDLLALRGLSIPMLYKHYAAAFERGGIAFPAFSRDPEFGGCMDGLLFADLHKLKARKSRRYLRAPEPAPEEAAAA
tara:strand:- start:9906 stop:11651 length:1746 start_codon:yes stop_codon:yes gene_type:complete